MKNKEKIQEYQMLTEIFHIYFQLRNLADSKETGRNVADS